MRFRAVIRSSSPAGFSLPEVLISVAVASVALLAICLMTVTALHSGNEGRSLTMAGSLAQERMEQIVELGYAQVGASTFPPEEYGTLSGLPEYRRTVSVIEDSPETGIKTISVTVSWKSDLGQQEVRTVSLATFLSEKGDFR